MTGPHLVSVPTALSDPRPELPSDSRSGPVLASTAPAAPATGLPGRTGLPGFVAGLALDATAAAVAVLVAGALLGGDHLAVSIGLVALWVGLRVLTRPPGGLPGLGATRAERVTAVVRPTAALGLTCWVANTLAPATASSTHLLLATVLTAVGTAAAEVLRHRTHPALRVVVVGSPRAADIAAAELADAGVVDVVGACTVGPGADGPDGLDHLESLAAEADAVLVLPGDDLGPRDVRRLGWRLQTLGVPLVVNAGTLGVDRSRARLTRAGEHSLLVVRPSPLTGPGRTVKELVERAVAAVALLVLAPALLAVAIGVRRDSPGSAIFRQVRVGHDGRLFTMLKFRTMTDGSETQVESLRDAHGVDHMLFKLASDPRVTRVGAVLRRYSLDELPQLINVVRGEMSLVGPRPALPSEVAAYDEEPLRRLAVKPGLTGLWQVSGRSDLSWEDSVRLDVDYVDNWSLRRDALIVLRTVGAVLGHRGAY